MPGISIGETALGKLLPVRLNEQGEAIVAGGEEQLAQLGNILASLGLVATEQTAGQIRDAVTGLGAGATLADLAAALAPVATEATSQAIFAALAPLSSRASEATAQDILAALGPLATSLDAAATVAAITALGGSKTLADVHAAILPIASEATATAIATELFEQGVSLDGVVTTLGAIEGEVDDLEPDADATRVAAQSLDTKILAPLGGTFNATRGTATVSAAQLPSSSTPRGFVLENIDAAADLWVGVNNTVTTASGFRIAPSRSRYFDLGNPNTLWVISASTTAWQIGAVT